MNKDVSWTLMEVPVKLRENSYYVYPQEYIKYRLLIDKLM